MTKGEAGLWAVLVLLILAVIGILVYINDRDAERNLACTKEGGVMFLTQPPSRPVCLKDFKFVEIPR